VFQHIFLRYFKNFESWSLLAESNLSVYLVLVIYCSVIIEILCNNRTYFKSQTVITCKRFYFYLDLKRIARFSFYFPQFNLGDILLEFLSFIVTITREKSAVNWTFMLNNVDIIGWSRWSSLHISVDRSIGGKLHLVGRVGLVTQVEIVFLFAF